MIRKLCGCQYMSQVTHGLGLCRLGLMYCTCFFASFHRFYGAKRNCLQGKSPSADNNCTLQYSISYYMVEFCRALVGRSFKKKWAKVSKCLINPWLQYEYSLYYIWLITKVDIWRRFDYSISVLCSLFLKMNHLMSRFAGWQFCASKMVWIAIGEKQLPSKYFFLGDELLIWDTIYWDCVHKFW